MIVVDARNPQFKVRIVSHRFGELPDDFVRPSVSSFTVRRKVGDAAGSFTLSLRPRDVALAGERMSWSDVIDPMDFVELKAWVPGRPGETSSVPLMRGLVDTVGQSFDIASGIPRRDVTVQGRDFGKLSLITVLYYLSDIPVPLDIMQRWRDGFNRITSLGRAKKPDPEDESRAFGNPAFFKDPDIFISPSAVIETIFGQFYDLQRVDWQTSMPVQLPAPEVDVSAAKGEDWERSLAAISPQYNPQTWRPFADVWSLFRFFQHAPWRELLWREGEKGPVLHYRPAPWKDISGNPVQPAAGGGLAPSVGTWPLTRADLLGTDVYRTDEAVKNYFFTYPGMFESYAELAKTVPGVEGLYATPYFESNPWLIGFRKNPLFESSFRRHGLRVDEHTSPYFDIDRGTPSAQQGQEISDVLAQGKEGNERLVRALGFGALLEFGHLTIKGNELVRAGDYVALDDGSEYYVEAHQHSFRVGSHPSDGHFTTSLEVSRGTGHLLRAKAKRLSGFVDLGAGQAGP